jgi:Glyoxalase-like domain
VCGVAQRLVNHDVQSLLAISTQACPQGDIPRPTIVAMSLTFSGVVFDAIEPARVAEFWAAALEWTGHETGTRGEEIIYANEGETQYGPPSIVFQPVPEIKGVKNRVHLDLYGDDQAGEVARLERLGASRVDVGQDEGRTFIVLADVEGNEFCVLREP